MQHTTPEPERLAAQAEPRWRDRPTIPGLYVCVPVAGSAFKSPTAVPLSQDDLDRGAPFQTEAVYGPIPSKDSATQAAEIFAPLVPAAHAAEVFGRADGERDGIKPKIVDELVAMLERTATNNDHYYGVSCKICGTSDGHLPDCELVVLLDRARAVVPSPPPAAAAQAIQTSSERNEP